MDSWIHCGLRLDDIGFTALEPKFFLRAARNNSEAPGEQIALQFDFEEFLSELKVCARAWDKSGESSEESDSDEH